MIGQQSDYFRKSESLDGCRYIYAMLVINESIEYSCIAGVVICQAEFDKSSL